MLDDADAHAEEAIDAPHPLGVAAGEVVVHRDHVDALARQRIEIRGQRRDQRLALAGLHLGDAALVQHHPAQELHVEVPHVERAATGLAHDRKGVGQQVVERLARGNPCPEGGGLTPEVRIAQRADLLLAVVDLGDHRP